MSFSLSRLLIISGQGPGLGLVLSQHLSHNTLHTVDATDGISKLPSFSQIWKVNLGVNTNFPVL